MKVIFPRRVFKWQLESAEARVFVFIQDDGKVRQRVSLNNSGQLRHLELQKERKPKVSRVRLSGLSSGAIVRHSNLECGSRELPPGKIVI